MKFDYLTINVFYSLPTSSFLFFDLSFNNVVFQSDCSSIYDEMATVFLSFREIA